MIILPNKLIPTCNVCNTLLTVDGYFVEVSSNSRGGSMGPITIVSRLFIRYPMGWRNDAEGSKYPEETRRELDNSLINHLNH